MKKYYLISILFYIISINAGYCQQLKEDGFKISYVSFSKQEIKSCGKSSEMVAGVIKVKTKGELKGEYPFYFAEIDAKNWMFTIKDKEKKIIGKLSYDKDIIPPKIRTVD